MCHLGLLGDNAMMPYGCVPFCFLCYNAPFKSHTVVEDIEDKQLKTSPTKPN